MAKIYLSLGSNLGNRRANLDRAIRLLKSSIQNVKVSRIYETRPFGYEKQGNFLNMAMSGETALTPEQLLSFVKGVETKVGRAERFRFGPREIDVDIVFYDSLIHNKGNLKIPHPGFRKRDFVLRPLIDLDPRIRDPLSKKTVTQLYSELSKSKPYILFDHGLFIGRFQPFHRGHLHALEAARPYCKTLAIGIGSAGESGTRLNPFPSKTRIKIIKAGLRRTKMSSKVRFLEIPDFHDNEMWFNYITKKDPKIDVVFSQHKLVKSIFLGHGIPVISPQWYERKRLAATAIRELIRDGKSWQDRVPRSELKEINAHKSEIK